MPVAPALPVLAPAFTKLDADIEHLAASFAEIRAGLDRVAAALAHLAPPGPARKRRAEPASADDSAQEILPLIFS